MTDEDASPAARPRLVPDECRVDAAAAALRRAFTAAGLDSPALDARILVRDATGLDDAALLTRPDTILNPGTAARLDTVAARRLAREPIARILGEAEFWGLPFRLGPDTLVPRPDTETLVAAALACRPDAAAHLRVVDLGTGSGCILVAILHERPNALGLGIDMSEPALAVARGNARLNGLGDRALFARSDWGDAVDSGVDLVVSNPPYIASGSIAGLEPEVARFDPPAALDGGPDGLAAYRSVLGVARRILAADGTLVLELGHDQRAAVTSLAEAAGFAHLRTAFDLGGHGRALVLAPSERG